MRVPWRLLLVPVLIVPVALLLGVGLTRNPSSLPSPLIGKPGPEFSLVGIDGRRVSRASLLGRPVIINFWASSCAECKVEHPVLLAGQARYGNRVAFVGVLYQDRPEDAMAYLARLGDPGYPNLIDTDGRLALDFGVTGVPETYFLDAAGVVRFKQWGPLTTDVLDAQLRVLGATAGAAVATGPESGGI